MCKPNHLLTPSTTTTSDEPCHVVISGAGPAGLLLTILLLQRNEELSFTKYHVTLIDNREDLGILTQDQLKKRYRSWMLGLAGHGVTALKQVKNGQMYEKFCQSVGIPIQSVSIHLGSKEIKSNVETPTSSTTSPTTSPTIETMMKNESTNKMMNVAIDNVGENFIVDRNFIVASLARYLHHIQDQDTNDDDDEVATAANALTTLYQHKVLYVDHDHHRVLIRKSNKEDNVKDDKENNEDKKEFYISYDLLIGCDGARSVVREAMIKKHSDFEMDVGDIFQCFKAVHVQRPKSVDEASMHIIPEPFPGMQAIALPETQDMLNISMGIPRHLFDNIDGTNKHLEALKSSNPDVVASCMKEHFKAFELLDYEDFAKQWVNQNWNRTAQVHCNKYHSTELGIVLMGDAAHATSPSIGMGMNQALKDAQIFYLLLQSHKDDLTQVLTEFSNVRVKEGNSLTDLAMNLYCFNTNQMIIETIHTIVRSKLHTWFPSYINPHPQMLIGRSDINLSDCYDLAKRLGIISKFRTINNQIRQDYFEQQIGMIQTTTKKSSSSSFSTIVIVGGLVAALAAAVAYSQF